MKMTRNKVFMVLAAGAVALGIVGGIAVASTVTSAHAHGRFGGGGTGDGASLASLVADKLNEALNLDNDITGAQVQTAFNGVTADRQDERLEAKLDDLEADDETQTAITDWFDDYPYSELIRLRPIGLAASDKVTGYLERLVEKEEITQTQSDGIQSWYDERPELPEGLEMSARGRHRGHHGSNRDGDGNGDGDTGTSFRGRHGRGGGEVGSFFRGRFGRSGGNGSIGNSM